jgi:hypothetical protein
MVRAVNNTPVPASVVALDSKIDLALMKTATRPIKVAPLRVTPPVSVGDQIVVFGFPLTGMLSSTGNATFGNISATLGMLDNPNHFQISAAVQTGNSGGPLLDSSGNVIGIVFAKLGIRAAALTGDLPQNINFAVKSSVAAKFLTDEGIAFETSEKTAELPKAEIVEMAKAFSVEIKCDSASVSQPRAQERPAITLEKRSAEFLVNHYAAVSSDNNAALEYAMRTYAPELDYFGQKMSRNDIIGQLTRSYSRWPIRKYSLEERSVSIECNESSGICKAKGTLLFDARSTERGQHSRGRATFEYILKYSERSGSPVIVQENGATLARQVEALGAK